MSAHRNNAVLAAYGHGTITGPPGQDKFVFNARMREDGTVRGRVKFFASAFGKTLRGKVVCMARRQTFSPGPPNPDFVPRDFIAIGTDIPSPDPENTGPFFVLSVVDGGKGHQDDKMFPDFIPDFAYPDGPPSDAAASCEAFGLPDFLLDIGVINSGDIRVRP
ncbi:MAG: hypothetical protein ACR2QM_19525 [Longimicrobiales bacterium]